MAKRIYGHTRSGKPIDNELIEKLADEAEQGFGVDAVIARRGRRGRPRLGSELTTVESVRLDPELKDLLVKRANAEGVAVSEVIRAALRRHLEAI